MFISEKHKFIFLEVPRTGSRSISDALAWLDPECSTATNRKNQGQHVDYHNFSAAALAEPGYRVIATHRNPYDRLWSFWKHRHKTGNPEIFKMISWPTYVDWVCQPEVVPELQGALRDIPISEMFDTQRVDFWLDFVRLDQGWLALSEFLGLGLPSLPNLNASAPQNGGFFAYTDSMARRVGKRFDKDFELFGYSRDSWKAVSPKEIASDTDARPARVASVVNKKRVAILTHFVRCSPAFSLQRVVLDQLAMLSKSGYEPIVLVMASEAWAEPTDFFADPRVRLLQYPAVKWVNSEAEEDVFFSDVEQLANALDAALKGVDVVLTHDLIYVPRLIKLCLAARQVAERYSKLRWLHWIHSATTPSALKREGLADALFDDLLAKPWPGSYPVFFNRMSIPRISQNFSYDESAVKIIPHPTNVGEFFSLSPLATRLYEEKQLYLADFVTTVPARLDRGKQVEWVIRIFSCLKSLGHCVRIIVMDFHSQSAEKNGYRQDLKALAEKWGLGRHELTFLSEFDPSVRSEAPHSLVRELFSISTVYVQPSRSESYSLSAQEAAMCGNLLVLNDDFPPLREIFGEQALYCQFSSNIDRIQLLDGATELSIAAERFQQRPSGYPDNLVTNHDGEWMVDGFACHAHAIAQRIRHQFSNNIVLGQRQRRLRDRNMFAVFNYYLEPLIEAVCADA